MFSPKVLDRANTIEFRINNNEMKGFLGTANDLNMKALLGKGVNMSQNFISLSNNKSFTTKDRDEINKTLLNFFGELQKKNPKRKWTLKMRMRLHDGNFVTPFEQDPSTFARVASL